MFASTPRRAVCAFLLGIALIQFAMPVASAQINFEINDIEPCPIGGGSPCYDGDDGFITPSTDLPEQDVKELIVRALDFVLDFVLLIAVISVIIAGLYLIVSGGDEGQKDKAKKIIIYTIVGIIVILASRIIVTAVNSFFTQ